MANPERSHHAGNVDAASARSAVRPPEGRCLFHSVRIGSLEVPGNVWLAPMAGYTDAAFRSVCVTHGAPLCFTEMLSAEALSRNNGTTLRLLRRAPNEHLLGFQIFAADAATAAAGVRRIASMAPAIIDLNCGCSVPKVLKTGCGAALLRKPQLIGSMVAAMRAETDIPVTVKLRSGWDGGSINYLACAEEAVRSGASLVTLHARTRAQEFGGKARLEHITALKASCPVPVFGSGDLFSPQDCKVMLEQTGCDGVMIARGCLGNPFIFDQTEALLKAQRTPPSIDARQRLFAALEHLKMLSDSVGEEKACRDMRKHFIAYTKGMESGAVIRQSVVNAETVADYQEIVESYLRA
jgi:tRNA-dihydrouridine synthase B